MTDQSVFDKPNETPTQETPVTTPASTDVFANQLSQIKNDKGEPKYASVDEALKGAAHAQTHIQELTAKLAELETTSSTYKSELEKRQSVEETLARLTSQSQEKENTTPPQGLDEGKVQQLIQAQLTASQQQTVADANVKNVNDTLIKQYGEKAGEQVRAKAKELGLSVERLQEMSKEAPKAVLQLFNITQSSKTSNTSYGGELVPSNYAPKGDVLEKPTHSLMRGATSAQQKEFMRKVKEDVYRRNGITG
jgi:vacuolar-type H+-ATPase subunit I/STV1